MNKTTAGAPHTPIPLTQLLACGALVVTLGLGVRHGFGLWLQPISIERGWNREVFAFAMAVQNITWGVAGLFAGMVADRFGGYRVIVSCTLAYAAGLALMALAPTPATFAVSAGLLIGIAQAGTTFAVVYGVIGRNVAPEKRSWAMGVAAAAGSFGQFLMVPVESLLIGALRWQGALFALAAAALVGGTVDSHSSPIAAANR